MLQPIYDNVLIRVESEVNDRLQSGIYIPDGAYDPDKVKPEHVGHSRSKRTSGTVVALPMAMYEFRNIPSEIKVNDTAYFHYNAIGDLSRILLEYSKKPDHVIPYTMIFCVVRDGEIIPIGGRVLCEKVYDGDVEEIETEGGKKITALKSKSGIIMDINVKHSPYKARVTHIGTPVLGAPMLHVKPGDIVYYEKDSDFVNEIEGKEYFVMKQENLLMKEE